LDRSEVSNIEIDINILKHSYFLIVFATQMVNLLCSGPHCSPLRRFTPQEVAKIIKEHGVLFVKGEKMNMSKFQQLVTRGRVSAAS
jgi:hypothetical protein